MIRLMYRIFNRALNISCERSSFIGYTGGYAAYEPLKEDNAFNHEYVVHGNGEYTNEEVWVNTCEIHVLLATVALASMNVSKGKLTQCLRAFQLHREIYFVVRCTDRMSC